MAESRGLGDVYKRQAFDYHIVTLAFLNAFALTGRTPTYMLTHGVAMGYELLGLQPVSFRVNPLQPQITTLLVSSKLSK